MFCTACGTGNTEVSNYCKQCGHKLDHAVSTRISEEEFDRALPAEEQVSALLERAYRLRKSGELTSAVRLCEEALRLNPDSTSVHSLLGQIHEQRGDRDAAIHEFERVLLLNPGSIADRVKLDELRGEGLPMPLRRQTAPHIVMTDHALPNPNSRQMLAVAGIAGLLMLLGGALALQFRSHDDKNGNAAVAPYGGGRNANRAETGAGSANNTTASANTNLPSQAPVNSGSAVVASSPGLPTNTSTSPYTNYPPPAIYVQERAPRTVYVPVPTDNGSRSGTLPNLGVRSNHAAQNTGDERVHLDEGTGGQYSITIHPEGSEGDTTPPANTAGKTNPGKSPTKPAKPADPPKNGGTIIVHNNGSETGTGGGGIAPPTDQAQSQFAIASGLLKEHKYEDAIRVYRRSLSGAGSQTGYVYQQMAICFQKNNDRNSARDNFNQAIAEYRKLEQANQQVDLARAGIKVCENGIKLCNAE